jgi:hypothetical protein
LKCIPSYFSRIKPWWKGKRAKHWSLDCNLWWFEFEAKRVIFSIIFFDSIYSEIGILESCRSDVNAFSVSPGFKKVRDFGEKSCAQSRVCGSCIGWNIIQFTRPGLELVVVVNQVKLFMVGITDRWLRKDRFCVLAQLNWILIF